MTQSFSSLSITNAICLTSLWIIIALGIYATKMQKDQDMLDLYGKCSVSIENGRMSLTCEKDEIHLSNGGTNESLKILNDAKNNLYNYLPFQSLTTVTKSLIWLGIVLDNAVCLTEFMVVRLKVQSPPVKFYWASVLRCVTFNIMSVICWSDLVSNKSFVAMSIPLGIWTFSRIMWACNMCCINHTLSNKVDGINNPVAYVIGPTGNKAMAGA